MEESRTNVKKLATSFLTGFIQATGFITIDRALYLSVKKNISFFNRQCWPRPFFDGYTQTILYRSFSGGLYFYLLDTAESFTNDKFLISIVTGSSNTLLFNPLFAAKYRWYNKMNTNTSPIQDKFFSTVVQMYKTGGIKSFYKGLPATLLRDFTFTFTFLKTKDRPFCNDIFAGMLSAVASSPFNYIRNKQYALNNIKTTHMVKISCDFFKELMAQPRIVDKLSFVQRNFCIGPGTFRVGLYMASGRWLYSNILESLNSRKKE